MVAGLILSEVGNVAQASSIADEFHKGEYYRLRSPFEGNLAAIEFVFEDRQTIILSIESKKATPNAADEYIRLEGLDDSALYQCGDDIYGGDYLMYKGTHFKNNIEHNSVLQIYRKIKK